MWLIKFALFGVVIIWMFLSLNKCAESQLAARIKQNKAIQVDLAERAKNPPDRTPIIIGLVIYVDPETQCQYFIVNNNWGSAMHVRIDSKGKPMCSEL